MSKFNKQEILQDFLKISTIPQQNVNLQSLILTSKQISGESKKQFSFNYAIKLANGVKLNVCKNAFMATYAIGKKKIELF